MRCRMCETVCATAVSVWGQQTVLERCLSSTAVTALTGGGRKWPMSPQGTREGRRVAPIWCRCVRKALGRSWGVPGAWPGPREGVEGY